ncbi:hypothetical protein C8Q73DRAFT_542341 [Cubamyces lactineus]|nr:hypothetical protein C8Q73DRAFT_542341 [Cubamyces lactineus]
MLFWSCCTIFSSEQPRLRADARASSLAVAWSLYSRIQFLVLATPGCVATHYLGPPGSGAVRSYISSKYAVVRDRRPTTMSNPSPNSDEVAATASMLLDNRVSLASIALLAKDFVVTFGSEVRYVWSSTTSGATNPVHLHLLSRLAIPSISPDRFLYPRHVRSGA